MHFEDEFGPPFGDEFQLHSSSVSVPQSVENLRVGENGTASFRQRERDGVRESLSNEDVLLAPGRV